VDDAPDVDEPVKTASELLADAVGKTLPPVDVPLTMGERLAADRKKNAAGKPRRRSGTRLSGIEMRGKVVALRIQGLQYDEIAMRLGIHRATAAHHVDTWVMEQTPAADQVEAQRQVMDARLEELYSKYWHRAMGLSPKTGLDTPEGPQEKSGELLLKIMDRKAKLMGIDMQPNQTTLLISAESIAAYLGWDDAPGPDPATIVDVKAIEAPANEDDEA
jgi:DNA-binding CsgD family transcriptional regulator